ncbi:MAG: pyruvate, phosphate dikinase [Bacillota bacterium]
MGEYLYFFEEGQADMWALLGGKGANLAEMTRIGLPVPPGFTVTTEACIRYYNSGKRFPEGLEEQVAAGVKGIEARTGRVFGDVSRPLLVSVRSGAAFSMPGMMDTILNLGLNDDTVEGLARETQDERFAYDCYRRFIQMFGNVVLKVEHDQFESALARFKGSVEAVTDQDLKAGHLKTLVREFKNIILAQSVEEFPQDPRRQLLMAVRAVFESWDNDRAVVYRRVHRIPDNLGTAVNIQVMVFGNMGETSGTGVLFTRNPSTGEKGLYGEYLLNAQGEDVVAGLRTPKPIQALDGEMPSVYEVLRDTAKLLEDHYGDMQDIEFTIEKGRLYMLQTRTGKRTARSAVKVAVDMVREGRITQEEALLRVEPEQISKLLHRAVDPAARLNAFAKGLPASPGAATGRVVFSADLAEEMGKRGERVILVRPETTPDDMHGIVQAEGILTSRGGMTCHAAIVARGMGKPGIVGAEGISIDLEKREFVSCGVTVRQGDIISLDGGTGQVMLGEVPLVDPELGCEFQILLDWADKTRRLGVRANADTPEDARRAREFGAEGIGLCRTEHMFMAQDRLPVVQEMILADNEEQRRQALERLLPMQEEDFREILMAMEGYPVTIRLLDPPLHEFLPNTHELVEELASAKAQGFWKPEIEHKEGLLRKARGLAEANPMLGFRGCRLGVVYPEIYEMQTRAIFQAVAALIGEGRDVRPEVMIPLVSHEQELAFLRERVETVAEEVMRKTGVKFPYHVGTMIEVPRAALTADRVAVHADFFSFGTNDLTQTTYGFSRDDAEARFLHHYLQAKILPNNPFEVLDEEGVGSLIAMAVSLGRKTKDLKIGICGEHGGEPRSIDFCHRTGLDYVSCSPYRVPVARLAAAQSEVRPKRTGGGPVGAQGAH